MYTKLVLAGGGIKGLAYLGMLEYFEKNNINDNIIEYVGCSIGAFSALLILLDYKSTSLKKIFNEYSIEKIKDFKLSSFLTNYGLDSGIKLNNFIKIFIKNKNLDENITMNELYEKTNKKLITVVTNVNTKKTVFISKDTFPDIPVYLALKMSMNLPFIFEPVLYDGNMYVDGVLSCNFPTRYYSELNNDILCVNLKENTCLSDNITTFDNYLYNIIKSTFHSLDFIDNEYAVQNGCDVINIIVNMKSNFNLNLDINQKNELYICGYICTEKFFTDKKKTLVNDDI